MKNYKRAFSIPEDIPEDIPADIIFSVAFNSEGTLLASGSDDRTIKLWNVESRTEVATLKGHSNSVNSVAFNSEGTLLASGSDDNTIKL